MTGRVLTFLLFFLSACAQPRYVSPEGLAQATARAEASALRFSHSGVYAWIEWERKPSEEDFGSFLLKLGRPNIADGSPLPLDLQGEISVVLWMPSMGHGSSPVSLEKADIGTYRVSDVFFTMPGDWEIRVQRKSAEFGAEEAALAIRI